MNRLNPESWLVETNLGAVAIMLALGSAPGNDRICINLMRNRKTCGSTRGCVFFLSN